MAEGLALSAKAVVTLAMIIQRPELGLAIFSLAQLTHALVLVVVYRIGLSNAYLMPRRVSGGMMPPGLVAVSFGFLKQCVLKQLLTEGESILMTATTSIPLSDQGDLCLSLSFSLSIL